MSSIDPVDWQARRATLPHDSTLADGMTYLASYSQIHHRTEADLFNLTGTISIRNVNMRDTIYLRSAEYFDTKGDALRSYFPEAIYLAPLETVSIVIDEMDKSGGTGDNFLFRWSTPRGTHEPYFEGIFISTHGQQGISFTTRGLRVE